MLIQNKVNVFSDGGARGNPGPAGIGVVIYDANMKEMDRISAYIGNATNNQAEYKAVIAGLKQSKLLGAAIVDCFLDSELVVEQLNRKYKVKNKELATLFVQTYNLTLGFKKVNFKHIPRELNKEADKLVNIALDKVKEMPIKDN